MFVLFLSLLVMLKYFGNNNAVVGNSSLFSNASEIFGKPDINSGLIGGAALDAKSFVAIVNAF